MSRSFAAPRFLQSPEVHGIQRLITRLPDHYSMVFSVPSMLSLIFEEGQTSQGRAGGLGALRTLGAPASAGLCECFEAAHRPNIPLLLLSWADSVFLTFFAFSRINNLCTFNVIFGSIPPRASRISRSPAKLIPKIVSIFMNQNPGCSI